MSAQPLRHIRQAAGDQLAGRLRSLPDDVSEAKFQAAVRRYATELGWTVFCTRDSRGSPEGEPDVRLVHPRRKIHLMAELKTRTGRLSQKQQAAIWALRTAGVRVFVCKPADVEEIIEVLGEN